MVEGMGAGKPDPGTREIVLLAVGCAEVVRPLFRRWASVGVFGVYEQAIAAMAAFPRGNALLTRDEIVSRIDSLPHAHFDDSHCRDYYLMIGLGVLNYAASVALGVDRAELSDDRTELLTVFDHLATVLQLPHLVDDLRGAAARHALDDDFIAAWTAMQTQAGDMSRLVNSGLDVVARENGWPLDSSQEP